VYTVAVVVFLLIIYFLVNKDRKHKDKVGIFDVVYVLSTVYGLLLIVFLMSYGMVAVPKFFWSKSNYKSRIKKQ
jgi:NADH:ubiquinone oxidoreductase subunit 6 (subunit J)